MRKGLIKITNQLYEGEYHLVNAIFKRFRPVHIEFRYLENDMWYIFGLSDEFDILKEGEVVPTYDVIFTRDEFNNYTYEFKKA